MRASVKRRPEGRAAGQRQVNIRVEAALYRALEAVARQERRTVPQVVRHLLEEGLQQRLRGGVVAEDTSAGELGRLAASGGAFDWLAEEPELYSDRDGEPV